MVVFLGHGRELFLSSPTQAMIGTAATTTTGHVTTNWGHQAVIVFFVLSGFLVGGSVIRDLRLGRWSLRHYCIQRITRLWVVLIPALILGWAIDTYGLQHFAGQQTIYAAPSAQTMVLPHLSNRLAPGVLIGNTVFVQTLFVETLGTNTALWSLANEFWYYVSFPLLVFALRGPVSRRIVCILGLLAISFLVGSNIALYFFVWLAGVAVWLAPRRIPANLQRPVITASVVGFLVANVVLRRAGLPLEVSDFLLTLGFSGMLYCILHKTAPAKRNLYSSVSSFLSRISYSLYVGHLPLFVFLCAAFVRPWHRLTLQPSTLGVLAFAVSTVFLYSCLMHYCFEAHTESVRAWVAGRLWGRPKFSAAAGLGRNT